MRGIVDTRQGLAKTRENWGGMFCLRVLGTITGGADPVRVFSDGISGAIRKRREDALCVRPERKEPDGALGDAAQRAEVGAERAKQPNAPRESAGARARSDQANAGKSRAAERRARGGGERSKSERAESERSNPRHEATSWQISGRTWGAFVVRAGWHELLSAEKRAHE